MEKIKSNISTAISKMTSEIESECFCKFAIKGGYELFFRDMLYENLLTDNKNLETELCYKKTFGNRAKSNFIDIASGDKKNLDFLIEIGHNGTWQSPFFVLNHAIDNINESFDFDIKCKERYTISLLTNITKINMAQTFRLRKTYLEGIKYNILKNSVKVDKVEKYIMLLDTDYKKVKFETNWNGFEVSIYAFICGPFRQKLNKEVIKNAG